MSVFLGSAQKTGTTSSAPSSRGTTGDDGRRARAGTPAGRAQQGDVMNRWMILAMAGLLAQLGPGPRRSTSAGGYDPAALGRSPLPVLRHGPSGALRRRGCRAHRPLRHLPGRRAPPAARLRPRRQERRGHRRRHRSSPPDRLRGAAGRTPRARPRAAGHHAVRHLRPRRAGADPPARAHQQDPRAPAAAAARAGCPPLHLPPGAAETRAARASPSRAAWWSKPSSRRSW